MQPLASVQASARFDAIGLRQRLFGIEAEVLALSGDIRDRDPLWLFKKDFAKKRVLRDGAGKSWTRGAEAAHEVARAALQSMTPVPVGGTTDEERTVATAALPPAS